MERDRNNPEVRTRYAPSPTGIPHVGNIRTALFADLEAETNNGKFILRIEDTDQARKVKGAVDGIKESLMWLGADWDEYYVQSERLTEYKKYADELVGKGFAKEDEGAIRFMVEDEGEDISWKDAIGDRDVSFKRSEVDDFIILKKDGYPTYHLANVVDDHLMNITHVIRGDDWIPSTPKHILLYDAFGWEKPEFAHVPNVMGADGKKLSKRRGARSVLEYKEEGYLPEALLNYLMLLGWAPKNDRTIVNREEIVNEFSLKNVSASPAIFDEKKLTWMNGEYIRSLNFDDLRERLNNYDSSLSEYDEALVGSLIEPAQSRMKTLSEFKNLIDPFLNKRDLPPSEARQYLYNSLSNLEEWNKDEIVKILKDTVANNDINFKGLYEVVIGERQGLPLGDTFEILGKEKTLSLLE